MIVEESAVLSLCYQQTIRDGTTRVSGNTNEINLSSLFSNQAERTIQRPCRIIEKIFIMNIYRQTTIRQCQCQCG